MIDLGTGDPKVAAMLERALSIIEGPVGQCSENFFGIEKFHVSSEMYRLQASITSGPLDIGEAVSVGLSAAVGSLQQVSYLCQNPVPTKPVVLQSLLRTALVGSARVLYVLLPPDPGVRLLHGRQTLAQDCGSGVAALKRYSGFTGLAGVVPPPDLVESLQAQHCLLLPGGRPVGEGTIVAGMIEALIDVLIAAGLDDEFGAAMLRDHGRWLRNTYSGLAHAYSWTRLLWGVSADRRIPGDLPLDLHQVATVLHVGLMAALARAAPDSRNSTAHVSMERCQ